MGRSKLIFKITIITSVLTVVSFVIGLKWGIYGIALGYLFSTAVLFALLIYKSLGILEIGIKVYISIFAKETVILLLSVVLIKLLFTLITVESDFFRLLIGVSSILIIQSLYHYLFRTTIYKYLKLFIEGAKTT
jgi:PST family polysaccharide transporter